MERTNLPNELSSFLGREVDFNEVCQAIDKSRLVTLTGPGGTGKTRLALRVARHKLGGSFRDGVWFFDLSAVTTAIGVAGAVSRVMDLREEPNTPLVETLVREFAGQEMLLIFDNCEQVLDGCAVLAEALLKAAPKVRVLATSREPLHIAGETIRDVPPLNITDGIALFLERAGQVLPGFDKAQNAEIIGTIVHRLDGIPLAIELAAARLRMMGLAQILEGLEERFDLLSGVVREVTAHHSSLEASVAWSYDLMEQEERQLALRLCVLHGFTLATAKAIGSADDNNPGNILGVLMHLVDISMLQVDRSGVEPRYRFLETVRHFLLLRLSEANSVDEMRAHHFSYFLAFTEELAPKFALADGPKWLSQIQTEFNNLEDALAFAEKQVEPERFLRLVTALSLYYELRGQFEHGMRWFERALAKDPVPGVILARALWGAAHVYSYGGRIAPAIECAQRSFEMAKEFKDTWAQARALNNIGFLQALSTPIIARETLLQSVALGREIGDDWAVADGLKMVTAAWYVLHDENGAHPAISALENAGVELGSRFFQAWAQALLGYFARDRGELDVAAAALDASIAHSQYVGDPSTGGFAEAWSAGLDADIGQIERARNRLNRLLASAVVSGSTLATPEALFTLSKIELDDGNPEIALGLAAPMVAPWTQAGTYSWAALLLLVVAAAHSELDHVSEAQSALDEVDKLTAQLKNPVIDGMARHLRGCLALIKKDIVEAEIQLHEAIEIQANASLVPALLRTLEILSKAILLKGKPQDAARILCVVENVRQRLGLVRGKIVANRFMDLTNELTAALGQIEFAVMKENSTNISLDEIVEYVGRMRGKRARPLTGWQSLTPTERRVVTLVTEGLSNPQIAERMFIARGTAKIHVSHIFDKLDVTSRSELAARAVRDGFELVE